MVAVLAWMWATATAQAIIPWYVFWPLFILTQAFIWSCVFLGIVRKILGAICDAWESRGHSTYSFYTPRNKKWEAYKKQLHR